VVPRNIRPPIVVSDKLSVISLLEIMQDFTKLQIWQRSVDLAKDIYELTRLFPTEELYGITSQMRRCSTSVSANISEGSGRSTNKDFKNFLSISIGSLNELYTFIEISYKIEYIDLRKKEIFQKEIEELKRMIFTFHRNLKTT